MWERLPITTTFGDPIEIASVADLTAAIAAVADTSSPHVLVVLADTTTADRGSLDAFSSAIAQSGCLCMCCWGPGCEHLHDWIDACVSLCKQPCDLVTTWHAEESIADVLNMAMNVRGPDHQEHRLGVLIVGEAASAEQVEGAMRTLI